MTNKNTRRGFTLIELLVVVLIIGILAAVAVPQYRIAVEKSRTTQVLTLLKAIADAEEVYFLANGEYTDDYNELDISLPAEVTEDNGQLVLQDGTAIANPHKYGFVIGSTKRIQIYYFFNHFSGAHFSPGTLTCWARTQDNIGLNICKSLPHAQLFYPRSSCGTWGSEGEVCAVYVVQR